MARWLLADHQGSVRDVAHPSGTGLNHLAYDGFRNAFSQNSTSAGLCFGYTGRDSGGASHLRPYRRRYCDASVGRFIEQDPLGFDGGDTNLYRYVGNSPANFRDPSGLISVFVADEVTVKPRSSR